jgi:hypothetical protein
MRHIQSARKKIWGIVNKESFDFSDIVELQLINMQFMTSILSSVEGADPKKIKEFRLFLDKSIGRINKKELKHEEKVDDVEES